MAKNRALSSKVATATFTSPDSVTQNFVDDPDTPAAPTTYSLIARIAENTELIFQELRLTNFLLTQQQNPPLPDELDRLHSDLN